MSEIPQDIREKADAVADDIRQRMTHDHSPLIARALLAHERETIERCAKIAEAAHIPERFPFPIQEEIAAAIRETAR